MDMDQHTYPKCICTHRHPHSPHAFHSPGMHTQMLLRGEGQGQWQEGRACPIPSLSSSTPGLYAHLHSALSHSTCLVPEQIRLLTSLWGRPASVSTPTAQPPPGVSCRQALLLPWARVPRTAKQSKRDAGLRQLRVRPPQLGKTTIFRAYVYREQSADLWKCLASLLRVQRCEHYQV